MTTCLLRLAAAGAGVLAAPGLVLAALAPPAHAMSPTTLAEDSDPRAVDLLEQASRAAAQQAYTGTQYVSTWSGTDSVSLVLEVTHLPKQGSIVALRDASGRSGAPAFAADPGVGSGTLSVPGLDGGPLRLLPLNYDLALEPRTAAGVRRVVAQRADGSVAARFWLDTATGLLLRREVYDTSGSVVRASVFVDLRPIGPEDSAGTLMTPRAPVGRRIGPDEVAGLSDSGWEIPRSLPGQLLLHDARLLEVDGREVVALSYSDGLSAVSLFCQEGNLDPKSFSAWRRERIGSGVVYTSRAALPQRLVWSSRGRVWTMLADAPPATVRAAAAALPHSPPPHRGPLGRLLDGLGRLGSWLNPFD